MRSAIFIIERIMKHTVVRVPVKPGGRGRVRHLGVRQPLTASERRDGRVLRILQRAIIQDRHRAML